MANSHNYNFEGGEILSRISASWFVSYCYYNFLDANHKNWETSSTASSRKSKYNNSKKYHLLWLQRISEMNERNLSKNEIGLKGYEVVEMAKKLLKNIN